MSKDPAVLLYTSDFITGTLTMSDSQRGKYIILLCLQHQQGYLTQEDMMNICKTYDEKIFSKFQKDNLGYWYNERMKFESDKRKKYSESRSKNRNISKSYVKHMENENETKDLNNNKGAKKRKQKAFVKPTIEEVQQYFTENGYREEVGRDKWHYYDDADWFDSHGNEVLNWKQKMRSVWFKPENKITASVVYKQTTLGPDVR